VPPEALAEVARRRIEPVFGRGEGKSSRSGGVAVAAAGAGVIQAVMPSTLPA
jgi:hypothetical protein